MIGVTVFRVAVVSTFVGAAGWLAVGCTRSEAGPSNRSTAMAAQPEDVSAAPAVLTDGGKPAATAGDAAVAARTAGQGQAALQRAADEGKHAFLLFIDEEDEPARAAEAQLEAKVAQMADKAFWTAIDRRDPAEKELVDKYGIGAAPVPLVLALAPNGAVTAGFPAAQMNDERLANALASPAMESCLKALQDRKLVLLCAQNQATAANDAAMAGVNAFVEDPQYRETTQVVRVDPADAAEAKFMGQLQIDPNTREAVTTFLAPPGVAIARFTGATGKEALVTALTEASKPRAGGCCPGSSAASCGPAPQRP